MASRSPTTRDKAQVSNAAFGFAANHDVVTCLAKRRSHWPPVTLGVLGHRGRT